MENWWVYVLFAVTCALCVLIMTKTNRKYMNYYENSMTKTAGKKDDLPKDIWKKEGCSRSFDNAEYDLPEEDFFGNEKTELPEEEEIFSGLSEEEKNEILKETGLLEDEDGRE